MFKFLRGGLLAKRKQAKDCDILCLLQSTFSKQKQDRAIPFPIILLCYGSNSGVGSYTSIISRAANQIPIVNACSSCLSEISASAFFKLFEQSLLLFCESGSEFRFKPHNGFEKFAFVRAVGYGVFVWINVAVIQIFKCVHGFHPFPSQTPYHSRFRESSTFQNKKAATVSDSRRVS